MERRILFRLQRLEVPPGERIHGIDGQRLEIRRLGIAEPPHLSRRRSAPVANATNSPQEERYNWRSFATSSRGMKEFVGTR